MPSEQQIRLHCQRKTRRVHETANPFVGDIPNVIASITHSFVLWVFFNASYADSDFKPLESLIIEIGLPLVIAFGLIVFQDWYGTRTAVIAAEKSALERGKTTWIRSQLGQYKKKKWNTVPVKYRKLVETLRDKVDSTMYEFTYFYWPSLRKSRKACGVMYVMSLKDLQTYHSLPDYETAAKLKHLKRLTWSNPEEISRTYIISHIWNRDDSDDNNAKLQFLQNLPTHLHLAEEDEDMWIWMDVFSVPNFEPGFFGQTAKQFEQTRDYFRYAVYMCPRVVPLVPYLRDESESLDSVLLPDVSLVASSSKPVIR